MSNKYNNNLTIETRKNLVLSYEEHIFLKMSNGGTK